MHKRELIMVLAW